MAKYQAYDENHANQFITDLLSRDLERLTDNDEKDIEQYIRE
ncbi:Cro/Cl family transcriptional regulator [Streptococcus agalactiae STIR-CD-07]|nr:Cro/Cl family transcriptional regulator [Streptococcus agalactiae 138P]AHX75066.1 Cro/Cl family transcriptional regulator [Streptococcus agalactiae]EJZ03415.1 Cro/CI family transcriptional regulator [Streptococcus agalactiae STIR-CD-17]EPU03132.1 Cro/Cl family transcriptional regulator [Streptococcus agalactiae STIR-CD-13]EPU04731.1 Cro/Cl family transcriptional regulator [Streptococcus agalactiae STIR-CD-09]EPW84964.1 Cro/Cl family transcriptional regulator [Streptococcus agalactiae STIR-C